MSLPPAAFPGGSKNASGWFWGCGGARGGRWETVALEHQTAILASVCQRRGFRPLHASVSSMH